MTIFRDSFGSDAVFSPHLAAVVTGSVQLVASACSGILCDYLGRLPLLVASAALMTAALAGFGTFHYFDDSAGSGGDWLPLVCVLTFVSAYSIGLNPISWLLVGEVFPLEYRETGTSLATGFSYVCAFVAVKTFVDLREAVGLHGTFWTYAVISFLGLLFCLIFVPETRGKSLDEMETKPTASNESDPSSCSTSTTDVHTVV